MRARLPSGQSFFLLRHRAELPATHGEGCFRPQGIFRAMSRAELKGEWLFEGECAQLTPVLLGGTLPEGEKPITCP